jgi:CDP-glucose 4,6-dehydratase
VGFGTGALGDMAVEGSAEAQARRQAAIWGGRVVLVTGAAGLLGSWLSRSLVEAGAVALGLDNDWGGERAVLPHPGVERIDGDIRDGRLLAALLGDRRVDTVVHLAAQTLVGPAVEDPADTFSNNAEGTWRVLEACREAPAVRRIVVASSDKAYGDASGRPYTERMPLRGLHPYDASKAITDILAQSYGRTFGLPVAITRCANLYGGGDLNWSRIVPGTIRSVLAGEEPVIRSDGTFVRDYLYARDAVEGILALAEMIGGRREAAGTAVNFGAGHRLAVIDVARRIVALMGSGLEPRVLNLPLKEIPEQRVSAALARRLLGWRARTPMDEGLRETIDWYRAYLAAPATPPAATAPGAGGRTSGGRTAGTQSADGR